MSAVISIIAAVNLRGVIGRANTLIWRLPRDLARFRSITVGKPVLMGRRTFESLGRPLPGRLNVVITRDAAYAAPGCKVAHTVTDALGLEGVRDSAEVMIIGGSDVYGQFLARADRLYLTLVHDESEGDAFFPDFEHVVPCLLEPRLLPTMNPGWIEGVRWDCPPDERNLHRCVFVTWNRAGHGA